MKMKPLRNNKKINMSNSAKNYQKNGLIFINGQFIMTNFYIAVFAQNLVKLIHLQEDSQFHQSKNPICKNIWEIPREKKKNRGKLHKFAI